MAIRFGNIINTFSESSVDLFWISFRMTWKESVVENMPFWEVYIHDRREMVRIRFEKLTYKIIVSYFLISGSFADFCNRIFAISNLSGKFKAFSEILRWIQ